VTFHFPDVVLLQIHWLRQRPRCGAASHFKGGAKVVFYQTERQETISLNSTGLFEVPSLIIANRRIECEQVRCGAEAGNLSPANRRNQALMTKFLAGVNV